MAKYQLTVGCQYANESRQTFGCVVHLLPRKGKNEKINPVILSYLQYSIIRIIICNFVHKFIICNNIYMYLILFAISFVHWQKFSKVTQTSKMSPHMIFDSVITSISILALSKSWVIIDNLLDFIRNKSYHFALILCYSW